MSVLQRAKTLNEGIAGGISKFAQSLGPYYIEVVAEEMFKTAAISLASGITPEQLRMFAESGLTLGEFLHEEGKTGVIENTEPNAFIDYLDSKPDAYLLGLLDEVVPDHTRVIREYPDFTAQVVRDLRQAVSQMKRG